MKTLVFFDRGAAAFALCAGATLLRVTEEEWRRYEFDDHDGKASEALRLWRAGLALVDARTYFKHLRDLQRLPITRRPAAQEQNTDGKASTAA